MKLALIIFLGFISSLAQAQSAKGDCPNHSGSYIAYLDVNGHNCDPRNEGKKNNLAEGYCSTEKIINIVQASCDSIDVTVTFSVGGTVYPQGRVPVNTYTYSDDGRTIVDAYGRLFTK